MKRTLSNSLVVLGNIFEHFDKSLYSLLAPFIAHLFFPKLPLLSACLILLFPFGWIARPLGGMIIGRIGDRLSYEKALYISMLGMSLSTLALGVLPIYNQVGLLSPILLVVIRALMSFFAAGETTGAALILLNRAKDGKKDLVSSFYEMSGILGTMLASLSVALLLYFDLLEGCWRYLFIIGAILGFIASSIRKKKQTQMTTVSSCLPIKDLIKHYYKPILIIACVTGFSYANYEVVISLMNLFLPRIIQIDYITSLMICCALIALDFVLLPCFGALAYKIGRQRLMLFSLISFVICTPFAYRLLHTPSLFHIFTFRFIFVIIGVAFAAPFQAYIKSVAGEHNQYSIVAIGKGIGAQCLGYPAISLSLFLYQKTNSIWAPALYPMLLCFASIVSMVFARQRVYQSVNTPGSN